MATSGDFQMAIDTRPAYDLRVADERHQCQATAPKVSAGLVESLRCRWVQVSPAEATPARDTDLRQVARTDPDTRG
jgi:hypothetical protein